MPRIALSEVPETGTKVVELDGRRVLLCRSGETIHAMDEICPHQALSLDGARVRRGSIFCPHHGARFDLAEGKSLSPMTTCPLKLYAVSLEGDEVEITF